MGGELLASRFTLFADGGSNPRLTLEVVFNYPLCLSVQAFNDNKRAMELAEVSCRVSFWWVSSFTDWEKSFKFNLLYENGESSPQLHHTLV